MASTLPFWYVLRRFLRVKKLARACRSLLLWPKKNWRGVARFEAMKSTVLYSIKLLNNESTYILVCEDILKFSLLSMRVKVAIPGR